MSKPESAVGSPLPTTTGPGRELDELIAGKVFGWTFDESRCRVCGWPLRADVTLGCVPGNCSMRPAPVLRADRVAPYSTDIASAWLVVAKMREFPAVEYRNLRLVAWCYNRSYATFAADDEADWSEANGEHATPHAICLAALAALENASAGAPPSTGGGE